MCCWPVVGDVFLEGGYGGLDVAISGAQLGELLGYQVLGTGYCNTSMFNLGNWGVVICCVQQGNLEAAAFSMFNRAGVSGKAWGRSGMEVIACLGRYNKLSRH